MRPLLCMRLFISATIHDADMIRVHFTKAARLRKHRRKANELLEMTTMRATPLMVLSLLAAASAPAYAQDETADAEAMADEVMEQVAEDADAMADDVMEQAADDADAMVDEVMEDVAEDADAMADDVTEEMADDAEAMSDDVMEEVAEEPDAMTLEEVAASDPDLEMRDGEDGEPDAMVMLSDVLFAFGDASLEPEALDVLAGIADKLDGVTSLEIAGHTDSVGDEAYNQSLGQRRADAVRDWLIANTALTADVLTARGVGETDPIAPNLTDTGADNPEGRAQNRRVEFTLPGEG